jgi:GH25 family lysozyme M1 (1,4-beta-N-acetylmuramidase)
MPAGTIVTTTGSVAGGSWSATCPAAVSGSTWYAISAVDGTSVATLYGVSVAYAATGLFTASAAPPPPPAVTLEGIDVSHYQGAIDWPSVAAAGKRFAIMKATEGQTYVDPGYATNHAGARAAGLPVSAYHFARPSSASKDAVLQADWYAESAALLPGDLVPALDLEQTGGLSVSALQAWVGAWLGEVTAKLGVRPMIYTSPSFWAISMGDTTMFADQGYSVLWIAHWGTSSPVLPAGNWGGHGWTFWQYSSCGSVTAISGCVDLDRFNGSDLTGVTFGNGAQPPVAPPEAPPDVSPDASAGAPTDASPILTAIAPATVPPGGGDVTITLQGANFGAGISTAYWNATPLATTYVSPTQLGAVVPADLTAAVGMGSLTVLNQPPGVGTSAPATFSVAPPPPPIAIGASSALGLKPAMGFSAKTPKVAPLRGYVTWRFTGGAALAGQRVNVLVAKKANGAWGSPAYRRSAWADAKGVVTFWTTASAAAAINVRVQWPGDTGHGVSTSGALGGYWK